MILHDAEVVIDYPNDRPWVAVGAGKTLTRSLFSPDTDRVVVEYRGLSGVSRKVPVYLTIDGIPKANTIGGQDVGTHACSARLG